jgi:hypothetical protein
MGFVSQSRWPALLLASLSCIAHTAADLSVQDATVFAEEARLFVSAMDFRTTSNQFSSMEHL